MQSNFIEITIRCMCSHVTLLHIFRTLFPENNSGRLFVICIFTLRYNSNV